MTSWRCNKENQSKPVCGLLLKRQQMEKDEKFLCHSHIPYLKENLNQYFSSISKSLLKKEIYLPDLLLSIAMWEYKYKIYVNEFLKI